MKSPPVDLQKKGGGDSRLPLQATTTHPHPFHMSCSRSNKAWRGKGHDIAWPGACTNTHTYIHIYVWSWVFRASAMAMDGSDFVTHQKNVNPTSNVLPKNTPCKWKAVVVKDDTHTCASPSTNSHISKKELHRNGVLETQEEETTPICAPETKGHYDY